MVEGTVEWSQILAFSPSCLTVIGVYRYVMYARSLFLRRIGYVKKVYHLCTLALNAIY